MYYTSGRHVLHIYMAVTYLGDECYISGRWMLYIWTVTYLHVSPWRSAAMVLGNLLCRLYTILESCHWFTRVFQGSIFFDRMWLIIVYAYKQPWLLLKWDDIGSSVALARGGPLDVNNHSYPHIWQTYNINVMHARKVKWNQHVWSWD